MSSQDDKLSPPSFLHRLLKHLSLDWVSLALDLIHQLRHILCSKPTGPYENLDYEVTLELLDTTGKTAVFRKRQRVKFLQDNMIAFEDFAWGDGEILSNYKVVPGFVVDKYLEGDRWNILISLRGSKSSGDIEEFHMERTEKNTYLKAEEWLQTEIRQRTHHLRMNVILPNKRRCQRTVLVQRKSNQAIVLGAEHIRSLPDGRQLLSWETNHVQAYNVYTLKWLW
jgi:hypothetical protein